MPKLEGIVDRFFISGDYFGTASKISKIITNVNAITLNGNCILFADNIRTLGRTLEEVSQESV